MGIPSIRDTILGLGFRDDEDDSMLRSLFWVETALSRKHNLCSERCLHKEARSRNDGSSLQAPLPCQL